MVAAGWRVRLKARVKGVQPMSTPSPPHAAFSFTAKAVIGFWPANAVGDNIELYADEQRSRVIGHFHCLRQQLEKPANQYNHSLADFIAPRDSGRLDYVGAFAVTAGHGVEQLAAAYLSHDVLVLPSIQEGFGIVVAEALHAGLPVISTRCGGPEQMVRESEGGVLTGHARVELVDAIRRLADSPSALQRCSERGAAYAKRTLSTDTFIRRIGEIIESVVPMPRAPGAARAGMAP